MSTHNVCLALLMSTHNVCFQGEITKISYLDIPIIRNNELVL